MTVEWIDPAKRLPDTKRQVLVYVDGRGHVHTDVTYGLEGHMAVATFFEVPARPGEWSQPRWYDQYGLREFTDRVKLWAEMPWPTHDQMPYSPILHNA